MAAKYGIKVQHYGDQAQFMKAQFDRKWQAVRYIRQQLEIARTNSRSVGELDDRFVVFGEGGIYLTQFWPVRIETPPDKPIIFHPQLIPGVMAGYVVETRRVFKEQPIGAFTGFNGKVASFEHLPPNRFKPRYLVGDRLWVKETWATFPEYDYLKPSELDGDSVQLFFKATDEERWVDRWRSPLFLPRWASRITLTVTGVDVQRIKDITRDQAIASGISKHHPNPVKAYRELWDTLNLKRGFGWNTNPWTWVYKIQVSEENK